MADDLRALHEILWTARRKQGLTQSELARRVNCSQSAISMFESGRGDALAQEKVALLADILGIDPAAVAAPPPPAGPGPTILKYCPVDDCPSNVPYVARGQLCYQPALVRAPAAERTRCRSCGEFLEQACANASCGAAVAEGSFCAQCGTPYVAATRRVKGSLVAWAEGERARILALRAARAVLPAPAEGAGEANTEVGRAETENSEHAQRNRGAGRTGRRP